MRTTLFFAVEDDILAVIEEVEGAGPLMYTSMRQAPSRRFATFGRGAEIPDLGKATADSAINCDSFLVTRPAAIINQRLVRAEDHGGLYRVDQLANPDSVTLTPGGAWNEDTILHGRVATISASPISLDLMKRFDLAIQKHFRRIKAFSVGPKALALLHAGKRLTISVQSPRELDLTACP